MTVESNYAIAIATLGDWFKNLAAVLYQPMKRKTKTNRDVRAQCFPHFLQVTQNLNSDWFFVLFALAMIDWSK